MKLELDTELRITGLLLALEVFSGASVDRRLRLREAGFLEKMSAGMGGGGGGGGRLEATTTGVLAVSVRIESGNVDELFSV
jgi:hypothetical protein